MTHNKTLLNLVRPLLVAVTVTLLAGCAASSGGKALGSEIPERSQARWDALLEEDFETAYTFMSPGYRSSRSVAQMEIEFRTRKVQYTSAEYKSHSCDENVCTVNLDVGYKLQQAVPGVKEFDSETNVEERWIKSAGEWWFFPDS